MIQSLSSILWETCARHIEDKLKWWSRPTHPKRISVKNMLPLSICVRVHPLQKTLTIVNVHNSRQKVTWRWTAHDAQCYEQIFIFVDAFDKFKIPLRSFKPRLAKSHLFLKPHIFPTEHILFWEHPQYGGPLQKWILRVYKIRLKDLHLRTPQMLSQANTKYITALKLQYCNVLVSTSKRSPLYHNDKNDKNDKKKTSPDWIFV